MSENSKVEWTDHTFNPWERPCFRRLIAASSRLLTTLTCKAMWRDYSEPALGIMHSQECAQ
jgi:hypothetical protein